MNNIRDSVSNLKASLLKFLILFVMMLSCSFLFTGITTYATDSSADQGGSGSGSGLSGSTVSSSRSGWLIYVVDQAGQLKSPDVALREKNTVASEKLATVPAGTAVHVTGITEDEQWYQISDYEDIEVGYISGAYLASEKPSTSSSSGSTSSSESSSSTSTESESATTSESTSTPAETTQPEPETPAETTPAPETPSTSTGGSTTTAPNPGAQQVYDQIQNGGSSSGNTNANRFANIQDGSGAISGYQGDSDILGSLHAAD